MCVYARSAVRAMRCTASDTQYPKELSQGRSRCPSRIVRLQHPPPSDKPTAVGGLAQFACSDSHLLNRSLSQPGRVWVGGTLSDRVTTAARRRCAFDACSLEPPKLWIHIQDVTHKSVAVAVIRSLATLMLDGAVISPQPVQVVPDGPLVDEIRYFKAGDRTGALAIIRALKKVLPRLWLRDLSAGYDQVGWVEHGHYELWLAPGGQVKDH